MEMSIVFYSGTFVKGFSFQRFATIRVVRYCATKVVQGGGGLKMEIFTLRICGQPPATKWKYILIYN